MPNQDIIREYLVALGFSVDQQSLRKFEDSLKRTGIDAEKFAKSMTIGFVSAGSAVVAALTAVGAGTIALASNVAKQDLQFQIFARRMFIGTDAARKMKIALDSLGYSMEEIIWGPPELAERYRALIADQTNMIKVMGGDTGERAFRKIRDIEFEFTRMGPELTVFSRKLTEDLVIKLFGSMDNLETKLQQLNNWFQANIPAIADKVSNILVPAFKKLADIAAQLFTQKNVDWVVNLMVRGADNIVKDFGFLQSDNKLGLLWDKDKGINQNLNDLTGDKNGRGVNIAKARAAASMYGGSEAIAEFLALIQQESDFVNPVNPNPLSGAIGLGQVMKFNAHGKNLYDADQNLSVAAAMFFGSLKAHGGDVRSALNDYYGHGTPKPGQPTFEEYYQQYLRKYQTWREAGATLQNQAFHSDMGGVTINITGASATPDQIKKAVKEGIDAHVKTTSARNMAHRQGTYV